MEGSKKFEDAALRGAASHHVWKSRTSDLTVINLRDISEVLSTQEAVVAVPPAAAEVKRPVAPPSPAPPPRPTTGKQESLNALLSKLQLGRPAAEAATAPKTTRVAGWTSAAPSPAAAAPTQPSPLPPAAPAAPVVTPAPPPPPPPPPSSSPSVQQQQQQQHSQPPPVRVAEAHNPTFPDLREASTSAAGQFEFLTGTNIPGQGVVKKAEAASETSSMALFHDPLWGGGSLLSAFSSPQPARRSPKPQPRTSLSELYAASTAAATTAQPTRAFMATPPAATHTPVASPPVPAMATVTPLPTAMTPQHLSMMGGMVSAPAPQMTAPYPMYTMPLQYVPQPQFPGGVMYNSTAFFPYGTTAMMMPQPQHLPQGYPVASAAMMRPGTNVKAMPFVPGSTM